MTLGRGFGRDHGSTWSMITGRRRRPLLDGECECELAGVFVAADAGGCGVAGYWRALALTCGDNLVDEVFDLGAFVAEKMRVRFGGFDKIDFEVLKNEREILAALFDVVHGHEAYTQIGAHTQRAEIHGANVIFCAVAQGHDDVAVGVGDVDDARRDKMDEGDFKKGKEAQFEGVDELHVKSRV